MAIRPLDQLERRLPQIGRIRAGYSETRQLKQKRKDGTSTYEAPVQSDTWIFTAAGRPDLLAPLADRYGGRVEEWPDDRTSDTHRLKTDVDVIEVVLPPEPLSAPVYEKWDGGVKRRSCDGRTCTGWALVDGKLQPPVEVDCLCQSVDDETKHCKPKTHLRVLLPELPVGVFRLTTNSRNAMEELHSSAEVIRMAAAIGLPRASLRLTYRQKMRGGSYPVPVLESTVTFAQLEARAEAARLGGGAAPAALPAETRVALPSGAEVIDLDSEEGVM